MKDPAIDFNFSLRGIKITNFNAESKGKKGAGAVYVLVGSIGPG
jgi:hypothetical protein